MALENAPSGGDYYDFTIAANNGATIIFKIKRHLPEDVLGGNVVEPVEVDLVVLDGDHKGTVRRSERVINRGITNTLRRSREGAEVVAVMGWVESARSKRTFIVANPAPAEKFALARQVYERSGGDPWLAAERAALGASNLESAQPAEPEPAAVGTGAAAGDEAPW